MKEKSTEITKKIVESYPTCIRYNVEKDQFQIRYEFVERETNPRGTWIPAFTGRPSIADNNRQARSNVHGRWSEKITERVIVEWADVSKNVCGWVFADQKRKDNIANFETMQDWKIIRFHVPARGWKSRVVG